MKATIFLFLGLLIPQISSSNELKKTLTKDKKNNPIKRSKQNEITLHSESQYDREYLNEYRKMIKSLIGPIEPINLVDRNFLRRSDEHRTAKELAGDFQNKLIECNKLGLNSLHTVKVIQDEESNYVMLKKDMKSGKLYVEKSTRSQSSFDAELNFFKNYDKNNQYFPVLTCYMRTPGREERHSVVTEFIQGRDSQILAMNANKEQLKSMVKQLFEALVDLHRMGYIHADIKPGNVLVTDDFKVKLIDFGMATPVGSAKKYRGSPYTRAPELHDMCPGFVDVGIDWWAFGATVAIWYYYHYYPQNNHKLVLSGMGTKENLTISDARKYFQMVSSYNFTPFKWTGTYFIAGIFPSLFENDIRSFLALFLTIDPEIRTFDSFRLQEIVRNHEYFKN